MPRVKRGTNRRDFRKKTLERAKGFFLTKSKLNRAAQEAVEKAQKYAYVGRKQKKRLFRSLWIVRIGAACKEAGVSYSRFMHGLKLAGIELDRKVLSAIAYDDQASFNAIVAQSVEALKAHASAQPKPASPAA